MLIEHLPFLDLYIAFIGMVVIALIVGETPAHYPFQWLETYYHELSHGLVCMLTGGKIHRIKLNWDGSGWCRTSGGWRIPILLAGYAGAALWGGYIYMAGWLLTQNAAHTLLYVELGLLAIATLLWVRDLITLSIMIVMALTYWAPTHFEAIQPYSAIILQFIGIYVLLNAVRAPFHLIDGLHVGDGAALADITYIFHEGVWIALWIAFATSVLFYCAAMTLPGMAFLMWWL